MINLSIMDLFKPFCSPADGSSLSSLLGYISWQPLPVVFLALWRLLDGCGVECLSPTCLFFSGKG